MLKKLIFLLGILFMLMLSFLSKAHTTDFALKKIGNRIYMLTDPVDGAKQLAVLTQKGVVILNSFWSEITAKKFKQQWILALKRKDFTSIINTVDRLDHFGGNGAYKESIIIGHQSFLKKFTENSVDNEIKELIEMWRWKADLSRKRLPTHKPGSEQEKNEKRWLNTCTRRANELEQGFSLKLPTKVYDNRMTLDLGDTTLHLIYFGKTGYDGLTLVVIPEEKVAIIPGFIIHPHHLAPYPYPNYTKLDVPRWIKILEEILLGDKAAEKVIVSADYVWSTKRAVTHLNYIKKLWTRVKILESEGKNLKEIQELCSLDKDFAFVKEIQVYKDHGDKWVRPQHQAHVSSYFLQHKNLATEMIKKEAENSSFKAAIKKVLKMHQQGSNLYFDESDINGFGYYLMAHKKLNEAIEIFKLNVQVYPRSANVYDSLAEAYMKKGDTSQAIKNYKISLDLNPENENAQKMLKKLQK